MGYSEIYRDEKNGNRIGKYGSLTAKVVGSIMENGMITCEKYKVRRYVG